jgi:hypothetical protein
MDITNAAEQLEAVTRMVLADFESEHGYPPGDNRVVPASGREDLQALEAEFGDRVPVDIAAFFGAVAAVRLPDLWNGYFIGPTIWITDLHKTGEPRYVRSGGETREVMIVASNGGGVLYAVPVPAGGPVLVLPNGAIEDGVYSADQPVHAVAADFTGFLERLTTAALTEEACDPFDPYRGL